MKKLFLLLTVLSILFASCASAPRECVGSARIIGAGTPTKKVVKYYERMYKN